MSDDPWLTPGQKLDVRLASAQASRGAIRAVAHCSLCAGSIARIYESDEGLLFESRANRLPEGVLPAAYIERAREDGYRGELASEIQVVMLEVPTHVERDEPRAVCPRGHGVLHLDVQAAIRAVRSTNKRVRLAMSPASA